LTGTSLIARYEAAIARGELKRDTEQQSAAKRLRRLAKALARRRWWFFSKPPRGLYIWGDVGRGKSMLMDLFFDTVRVEPRRRVHFNAFMAEMHERIHALRPTAGPADPIILVAQALAREATLLCFDEFQVGDVADAMILGRLFEQLFARGVTIVATSNTPPEALYEGGLNRQLFLPFIAMIEARLDVISLNGAVDYRLQQRARQPVYLTPLGPASDAAMDAAWKQLSGGAPDEAMTLPVLGRNVAVPRAVRGAARVSFAELCEQPLAAADYLAIAHAFHTILVDHIPLISERNAARRFIILVDTLYDEGVNLVCSAAAAPEALYPMGDEAEAFRRTASRLAEMQSEEYRKRGHGIHA
jgi:cell division protein ZapE